MKKILASLFCCLFSISCASIPIKPANEEIYKTYLVNESSHFIDYVIRNLDHKVDINAGILPPKWAFKNPNKSWNDFEKYKDSGNLPWVLMIELPESLLGNYVIAFRFLLTREGAHEEGPWMYFKTKRTKEEYSDPKLIPYWEITDG